MFNPHPRAIHAFRSRRGRALALALCTAGLVGCPKSDPSRNLMLAVDTDIPASIDWVEVDVLDEQGNALPGGSITATLRGRGCKQLPLTLGVGAEKAGRSVTFNVRGYGENRGADTPVVSASAKVELGDGSTRMLPIVLLDACRDLCGDQSAMTCAADCAVKNGKLECTNASCRSVLRSPSELPKWPGGLKPMVEVAAQDSSACSSTPQPPTCPVGETCRCTPNEKKSCYTGPAPTQNTGACQDGQQTCLADGSGWGPCLGDIKPLDGEICGGTGKDDDDCDGYSDFADPDCACNPAQSPAQCYEDASGTALTGTPMASNECKYGTKECTVGIHTDSVTKALYGSAWAACAGAQGPSTEVCDTKDNDCNASTVDGSQDATIGTACDGSDTDLCLDGSYSCGATGRECIDATNNAQHTETCNGLDDNCDGTADEGATCAATNCTIKHLSYDAVVNRPYLYCSSNNTQPLTDTWANAKTYCGSATGNKYRLAIFNTKAEWQAVVANRPDANREWWFGLNQPNPPMNENQTNANVGWSWIDGTALPVPPNPWSNLPQDWPWAGNNPDNSSTEDCALLATSSTGGDGRWNDAQCGVWRAFVCEPIN